MSEKLAFFEYLNRMRETVEINDLSDMPRLIEALEEHHKFETAKDIKDWKRFFDFCISAEFNDKCYSDPIPELPVYAIVDDADIQEGFNYEEAGWYHAW